MNEVDFAVFFRNSFLKESSALQSKGENLLKAKDDILLEDPVKGVGHFNASFSSTRRKIMTKRETNLMSLVDPIITHLEV